jgi:hypothetical protein
MFKSILALLALSLVAVFLRNQLALILHALLSMHTHVAHWLAMVFSQGAVGRILQWTLGLVIVPAIIGVIVAVIMLAVKREHVKVALTSVWVVWTVLLVGMLAQHA